MSSIYFPAHVVVLFRRLVNVVSTLSISNQYFRHQESSKKLNPSTSDPYDRVEWPWWVTVRQSWDSNFVSEPNLLKDVKIANSYVDQASTVSLPRINKDRWPFISFSIERDIEPSSNNEVTPPTPNPQLKPDPGLNGGRKPSSRPQINLPGGQEKWKTSQSLPLDIIHQLMQNPALYEPIRVPRYPIVLCHGLYGFDARGPSSFPSMRMHYWSNVLQILRGKVGAEVIVTSVPGTGNISSRSARLDEQLRSRAQGRGVNFLAHSMGGLDCRHLISHIQPVEYTPLSLTTISTPHRGSPFMDWCVENIGIGKLRQHELELASARSRPNQADEFPPPSSKDLPPPFKLPQKSGGSATPASSSFSFSLSSLPSSFTTLLLSIVDSPAYSNLTSTYLNEVFNPATPDDPRVKYFSVAGRMPGVSIWHPFWLPKMILDGVEEKERTRMKAEVSAQAGQETDSKNPPLWANEREWGNDGLVTVQSAKWGEFLGIMEGCDHWELRGARGIEFGVDLPGIPAIGLGSAPSKNSNLESSSVPRSSRIPSSFGESWNFKEWGRFVGGWKKDEVEKLQQDNSVDTSSGDKSLTAQDSAAFSTQSIKERELKDDEVVRSSTDKLSTVLDWLIEQIPAPQILTGGGNIVSEAKGSLKATQDAASGSVNETRKLAAEMVTHAVAGRRSAVGPTEEERNEVQRTLNAPAGVTSEMKKRMDSELERRKKNELSSKEDLERFFVALSRKMWDEGL